MEGPNIIITLENFDQIEKSYSEILFPGLIKGGYYEISSHTPNCTYGYCSTEKFFKALKKIIFDENYENDKDREYLNHWRWFPRNTWYGRDSKLHEEGGHIVHYYTSRNLGSGKDFKKDFTRLSEMNDNTIAQWNRLNSQIIQIPLFRGGNPLKKLGLGIDNIRDLWWCDSENQMIGFHLMDLEKLILEI